MPRVVHDRQPREPGVCASFRRYATSGSNALGEGGPVRRAAPSCTKKSVQFHLIPRAEIRAE
jgi:hypothetical protein